MTRTRLKSTAALALLALATTLLVIAAPSGARATARASVTPFAQAALAPDVAAISDRVMWREGIDPATVVAVAPLGGDPEAAGILVASATSGDDAAAVYTSDGMTGFHPLDRVLDVGGVMAFPSAAGNENSVRRVALVGLAAPTVARVLIGLANGESLDAELTAAGNRGFRFFAYAQDDAPRFPVGYTAYDRAGKVVKKEDTTSATSVPCTVDGCVAGGGG